MSSSSRNNPGPSADFADSGDQRPSRIRWLIFGLACASSWFLYLHRYTWSFVSERLQTEQGFTENETSRMFAFFNFAYGFGQIPSGILGDLFGVHLLLGAIIIVWSLSTGCLGLSGSGWFLSSQRAVFGLAQAGCYPMLSKVSQIWFPVRIRTFLQGWIASFFGRAGGAMSSIILATVLMGWLGLSWQKALIVMAGAGVLFGVAVLVLFRNSPQADPRVNDAERSLIDEGRVPAAPGRHVLPWQRVWRHRSLLLILLMQFLAAGADTFYSGYLGKYFLNGGIDLKQAGALASLPLWGGAFGGMLGGFLNDRFIHLTGSRRWSRSIVGCLGPLMAAALLFVVVKQGSITGAAWALFAVKFFFDMGQPTVWGACTDIAGKYSATVFSLINTAGTLGGVFFPLLYGWIITRNTIPIVNGEPSTTINYNPLFLAVALAYIGSGLTWFLIDCTQSLDREE